MKWLPWDRLQLDPSVDGGWRVSKQKIFFDTHRTYKRKISWGPLYHKNGALFHSGNIDQKLTFIENLAEQNSKVHESSTIALFDFQQNDSTFGDNLESRYEGFEYHPYKADISDFIDDLSSFRELIRAGNAGSGYIEPPNRKVLTLLLNLDSSHLSQIQGNPRLRTQFKNLLEDSERDRIHLILMCGFADEMPSGCVPALDWIVYLGERNKQYAKKRHSDLPEGYYSFAQVHIGSHYSPHEKRLMAVHPLKFTPSEWLIAEKEKLDEEDAAYERFLETLNDGSEDVDKINESLLQEGTI